MKIRIRSALAGAAATAVVTGIMLVGGTPAYAAVTPGWEPEANVLGAISFYNASGVPVTGGTLSSSPVAVYAAASGPGRTGDTKAQLRAYTPQVGVPPASWTGDTLGSATNYPNSGAPANIASLTVPVATGVNGDFSMNDYIGGLPNNSATAGYQNLYELRLYTSGPTTGVNVLYYRADIEVNPTAGTWTVVYPVPATPTSTTLADSPASPAPSGTAVTLTATVSPAAAGAVHFFDGATDLGAGTYNAATGVATKSVSPTDGVHSFTAQFTSSDVAFTNSNSAAVSYTLAAALTPTNTTLSASPASPVSGDASGHASVTLTTNVTPTGLAGGVHVFDGATDLGAADTYTAATGVATKVVSLAAAGSPHHIVATFTPSDGTHSSSTSAVVNYVVLPANYGTSGIPVQATDNTDPYAGALTLQVAVATSVNLVQVDPTTPAGHPVQATDPTGHRHAWVFNGNLSGVSVSDTRPAQSGWTLNGQAADFTGPTTVSAKNLGWTPALVTAGSDAEGTLQAGAAVNPMLQTATSNGLAAPGSTLASAGAGNGLGSQNISAAVTLRMPDTNPKGTYNTTLTLTLVSP